MMDALQITAGHYINSMEKLNITDRRRFLEIVCVCVTAIGKFIFMDFLNIRFPYVALAVLGWVGYVYYRHKQTSSILNYWGFRTDNLKKSMLFLLPFAVLSIVLFMVIGFFQNTLNPTWHILPIMISYPIWGIIQQFLIMSLVAGNLHAMKSWRMPKTMTILVTALLFSVVHYPDVWLMSGTFVLALFYGFVFLKLRNIYALGIFHGWLGAFFYYTVVGTDPFAEVFLALFA